MYIRWPKKTWFTFAYSNPHFSTISCYRSISGYRIWFNLSATILMWFIISFLLNWPSILFIFYIYPFDDFYELVLEFYFRKGWPINGFIASFFTYSLFVRWEANVSCSNKGFSTYEFTADLATFPFILWRKAAGSSYSESEEKDLWSSSKPSCCFITWSPAFW